MKLLCSSLLSLFCFSLSASESPLPFHASVSSGYAWSMKADIRDVDETYWAAAEYGYNKDLGSAPFVGIGVGYQILPQLDSGLEYTLYGVFQYQNNQTDPSGVKRTRSFSLNHQSALFHLNYLPYTFSSSKITLSPVLGLGLGVGVNQLTDFQTVLYDPVIVGLGITTSIGPNRTTSSFAWQGLGGIHMKVKGSFLSLDLAYRYYNGGTFKTPSTVINYNGLYQGDIDTVPPWKGTLQTQQVYFSINFSV